MSFKKLAVIIAAVLILALTGAAYAEEFFAPAAQPGDGGGSGTAAPRGPDMMGGRTGGMMGPGMAGGRGGGQLMMRLIRGLVRGELLIQGQNGKLQRVRIDRGTVTEATAAEIKITEKGGKKLTISIDADTKVLGKKIEEIQKGDRVEVIRVKKGKLYKTAVIVARPKPADQPLGDLFGGADSSNDAPESPGGAMSNGIF